MTNAKSSASRTPPKKSAVKRAKAPAKKAKPATAAKAVKPLARAGKKAIAKPAVSNGKANKSARTKAKTNDPQTAKHTSPMWKFLEMKEAKRKAQAEAQAAARQHASNNAGGYSRNQGFARFSGPRRRAA